MFFFHMDIEYKYEEEYFNLDGIWYRPDFWLPKQNCWFEIKGPYPIKLEKEKARRLAVRTEHSVYVWYGDIPVPRPDDESWCTGSSLAFFPDGREEEAHWWCDCPHCGTLGLEDEGRAASLPCGCLSRISSRLDISNHYFSPRLMGAFLAAREAETYRKSDEYDLLVEAG
jgi:hypothetical protein